MTTTTKIFVVLVCVFAFIFTPMAIQFAASTHDWRKLAEEYRSVAETSTAHQRSALAITASQITHYGSLAEQARKQVQERDQRITELTKVRDGLALEKAELTRQQESWRTSAERLTAEMAVINAHNQQMADANKKLTEAELDLRTRNNELSDRVKELTTEKVILKQQLHQAQEIAAFHSKENEELRKQLRLGRASDAMTSEASPTARAETPAGWSEIRGEVTKVHGGAATINVGSSAGVKPNMTMVVLRGNDYVCDLVVTEDVTPTEAVASIDRNSVGGNRVRPGDSIIDVHSFNSR